MKDERAIQKKLIKENSHSEFKPEVPKPEAIDNRYLLEGNDSEGNPIVSRNVLEGEDYEIISASMWNLLESWYTGGPIIQRKVIELGFKNEKYVEVRPMNGTASVTTTTTTNSSQKSSDVLVYQKSIKSTLNELKEYICKKESIDPSIVVLYNISNPLKEKLVKKMYSSLEDLKLSNPISIRFQIQGDSSIISKFGKIKHFFKKEKSKTITRRESRSNSVSGSSNGSNISNGSSNGHSHHRSASANGDHYQNGTSTDLTTNGTIENGVTDKIMIHKGVCGLVNLGNTCFMNSSLQCLAHTYPLTEYFLSGRYTNDINKTNPLGMKGHIADTYGKLMKEMWSSQSCVAPKQLKWIIGKYAPQFSGISQQDAQEFLSFLLDGLHEDLNKVLKKPYSEEKEDSKEQREDSIVASEQWESHLKRNQSVIVNLFQGQYKSTLVCNKCSKVSITFDPFMFVTLPIPISTDRIFDVILYRNKPVEPIGPDPNGIYCLNNSMAPVRYCIKLNKRDFVETLRLELSKATGIQSSCIALAETYRNRIAAFLSDTKNLVTIRDREVTIAYELPVAGEEISRIHVMNRRNSRNEFFLYPFVILLNFKETTCKDLYRMVWERVGYRVKRGWKSALRAHAQQKLSKENIGISPITPQSNHNQSNNSPQFFQSNENNNNSDNETTEKESHISSPEGSQFEEDDTSSITDDESFECIYPFVLKIINPAGDKCDRCPSDCSGCVLECDNKVLSTIYKNQKYWREGCSNISIDWRPEVLKFFDDSHNDCSPQFTVQDKSTELRSEFKNEINLNDCFSLFTKSEKLGPNDTWYCPQCKEHIEGSNKKLEIWKTPKILIIHLKRFYFYQRHEKINAYIDFPLDNLDLSKWVLNKSGVPPIYQLYAVSNHMGNMGTGHYTAFVKNREQWYSISDGSYHSVDKSKIKTPEAYVLFYELKQPPSEK
eukprot:gene3176-3975_t